MGFLVFAAIIQRKPNSLMSFWLSVVIFISIFSGFQSNLCVEPQGRSQASSPKRAFKNPMINEGMFEGDMAGIPQEGNRNAIANDNQRWTNGVIPYVIDPSRVGMTDMIERAMRYIESETCLRFVKRTNESDYIIFERRTGCNSNWGRAGGAQTLSLGEGCENFAVVIHEILHALGFEHEHNRSDRDNYLTIQWQNIEEQWYSAFRKLEPHENRLLTPFDYNSIMLYGSRAFVKDYWSNNYSMVTKDGGFIEEIHNRTTMTNSDITKIKMLYNC